MSELKQFKNVKKAKVIVEELEKIDKIIETTLYALKDYHYYIPIAEILSTLKNNKTMLKLHKKHHQEIIDNYNKKE